MKITLQLFICFCLTLNSYSQANHKLDSLLALLKKEKHDTIKVLLCSEIKKVYAKSGDHDKALEISKQALLISYKIKSDYFRLFSLNQKGYCFERLNMNDSALAMFNLVIKHNPSSENYQEILSAFNHIGNFFYDKNDYNNCLAYYQKHIALSSKFKDSVRIFSGNANLGNIYLELKRPLIALENYKKGYLFINSKTIDFHKEQILFAIGTAFADCAKTFKNEKYADSAKYFLNKSLTLSLKNEDYEIVTVNYTTFGNLFFDKAEYDSSIYYYNKSLDIRKEFDVAIDPIMLLNLANAYGNKGNYKKAKEIVTQVLSENGSDLGYSDFKDAYEILGAAAEDSKDYQSAYKFTKLSKLYSDSVFNESASEKRKELEMNFEFERMQELQKIEQERKDFISAQEIKEQKKQRVYLIIGLLFAAIFSIYIFISLKKQRKANRIISEQKTIVEAQKHLVEEKQKEIIDSIRYAKRIQQSLLPTKKYIEKTFNRLHE